ncbi:MAG TPA: septal ring lytic transglycosylase RlpA family protein [Kamptonema sp.]|nr:septal ring lytic transglycosylase RlpA family protein [Kamptonema sp.]
MKQKLVGGLLPVLLIPALVTPSSSRAQEPETVRHMAHAVRQQTTTVKPSPQLNVQPVEVVKVGEYQYQAKAELDSEAIAKIQSHNLAGHSAATVYLRNIPVLTFVESSSQASKSNREPSYSTRTDRGGVKVAAKSEARGERNQGPGSTEAADPVWRATAIAAKLNQLFRDSVDANAITVRWEKGDRYIINVNGEDLVEINTQAILPDTTSDRSADALQATNRLRRLLGNAPPLEEVIGKPKPAPRIISFLPEPVQVRITGWASWYGPGFHGNLSASGELYNQDELTAAHRDLPFGTRVLVTNLDNGRSVVVRINDRGPYVGDRLIDLSAAAAQVLGMVNSGIAPVQLQVINPQQAKAVGQ